jgi:hypothetical protein
MLLFFSDEVKVVVEKIISSHQIVDGSFGVEDGIK